MEQSNVKIGDCGRCNRPVMSTHQVGSITYRVKNPAGQLGPARSYLAHKECADQAPVVQEYPVVVTTPAEILEGVGKVDDAPPPPPAPSMPVKEQAKGQRRAPAKKAVPKEAESKGSADGEDDE